ncbi:MAG: D-glycero-beta-D-manno-heptose 1,7-bisphosphate 7-phosphatase [Pseudomonadota bacterium]
MRTKAGNKLVIVDRDGVINQDSSDYIRTTQQWQPLAGSIEALARLHRSGYVVAVATNQSGIGRGYFSREAVYAMHRKMRRLVRKAGGDIACIAFCPHHPDASCDCRKPLPGLLHQISKRTGIDLEGAALVGDSARDLQAGASVGCELWLVDTGNGKDTARALSSSAPEWWPCVTRVADLAECADALLSRH